MRSLRHVPAALYLALAYGFILLPVGVLVLFSFQSTSFPVPPFEGPSGRWYAEVLRDRRLTDALRHSLAVGLGSSLVAVTLAFLAAYALARLRPPGTAALRWLISAPLSVSYLIIGMGLLITFNAVGLRPSLVAVGLGHVAINLPLCFAILYSQMGEQQAAFERAARDLGASERRVLSRVTLPLLAPAVLVSGALSFTLSWDEFIIAFLLSRFEVTLPVEIWSLLRTGLDPKTNAVGSLVFGLSAALVLLAEALLSRRRK